MKDFAKIIDKLKRGDLQYLISKIENNPEIYFKDILTLRFMLKDLLKKKGETYTINFVNKYFNNVGF